MSKNPIIVFEGIETSGKSTNLKKTIKYFKKNKNLIIRRKIIVNPFAY